MSVRAAVSALAVVLVAVAIIAAFSQIGTPGHRRAIALDERRQSDILSLERRRHDRTPVVASVEPKDPVTGAAYEFRAAGPGHHEWCAVFDTDTRSDRPGEDGPTYEFHMTAWRHPAGPYCFVFENGGDSNADPLRGEAPPTRR